MHRAKLHKHYMHLFFVPPHHDRRHAVLIIVVIHVDRRAREQRRGAHSQIVRRLYSSKSAFSLSTSTSTARRGGVYRCRKGVVGWIREAAILELNFYVSHERWINPVSFS